MGRKNKLKGICLLIIAIILIIFLRNIYLAIRTGKQLLYIVVDQTCYAGSTIDAMIDVKGKEGISVDSKVTAKLKSLNGSNVKNANEKIKIAKGELGLIEIQVPKDITPGTYNLEFTATSGIYKDKKETQIVIKEAQVSNVTISLDKGIYKPGDTVNYRALLTSKEDDTPTTSDVKVSIFDGNDNKVYANSAKTSEYGIVFGSFTLADEVNSGTYRLQVETDSQDVTKTFTVNPYVAPKFEVNISSPKEAYVVGENIDFTVNAKYFFGEPVKEAEVVLMIDGVEHKGLTDAAGNYTCTIPADVARNVSATCTVTDSSNYVIDAKKNVVIGEELYNVEIIPDNYKIVKGTNNDIYVIVKKLTGEPIKASGSVVVGDKVKRDIITDENGFGKITLSPSDIDSLKQTSQVNISVSLKDSGGNLIEKKSSVALDQGMGVSIKTDKIKYNEGEDIEVSLTSTNGITSKYLIVTKNGKLIKTISTSDDKAKFNLDNITGLVEIYGMNDLDDINYILWESGSNYKYDSIYARKVIFIKSSNGLNIGIKTNLDQYKPGDNITIDFTTKDNANVDVDAAMLVSILDEAILSLAENDLSVDNLMLALKDIEITDEMSAADLYAMVLDETNERAFETVLLRQNKGNINLETVYYKGNNSEYVEKAFLFGIVSAVILLSIIVYILVKKYRNSENARNFVSVVIGFLDVVIIQVIITLLFGEFIEDKISIILDYGKYYELVIIFVNFVISLTAYVMILYKYKMFIIKAFLDLALIPILLMVVFSIISEIIVETIIVIAICIFMVCYCITVMIERRKGENGKQNIIKKLFNKVFASVVYILIFTLIGSVTDSYKIPLVALILVYIIKEKVILGKTNTKHEKGKIVLNLNVGELIGIIVGILFIALILVFITTSSRFASNINPDPVPSHYGGYVELNSKSDRSSSSSGGFGDMAEIAQDTTGASSSAPSFSLFDPFSSKDTTDTYYFSTSAVNEMPDIMENDSEINSSVYGNNSGEKEEEVVENVRNVFVDSLAFVPELVSEAGKASYSMQLSDNITTWNIQVIGNTKEGNVGYASSSFKVFKEFFVDVSLPTNSVVSDKVKVPVTVYNYTDNALTINLEVVQNNWATIGEYPKQVTVEPKATKMVYVPIEITAKGDNVLRIEARAQGVENVSDIIERKIKVGYKGLEQEVVASSGYLDDDIEQDILFNDAAIAGSKKVVVKLYPSSITQVLENMEGMLKLPNGCFEQTSSSLYPDILVLKYLKNNKMENEAIEKLALDYISKGYQKLLTYEVPGTSGGYSLYGNSPAETVITAFGYMEFNELKDVYDVDENVIKEMEDFIYKQRKVDGSFTYNSTYIGNTASTDDLAMNAYIIWALSEGNPGDTRIKESVEYLEKKFDKEANIDTYTLALMANVFANTNSNYAGKAIDLLMDKVVQIDDKSSKIDSNISDYYGSRSSRQSVQTTALTSMALTKINRYSKTNVALINYLISMKYTNGTWGTTQSTILALQAINSFENDSALENQTITIKFNDKEEKIEISDESLDYYLVTFDNVKDENKISLDIKKGKFAYEIVRDYFIDYPENYNKGIGVTQTLTENAKVNQTITHDITVNTDNVISNMMVKVSIPQGCSVKEDSLLNMKYAGTIEKYEYNYGNINIYLRNTSKAVPLHIEYNADYPVDVTAGSVKAYDYYNPDVEGYAAPSKLVVTE